MSAHETGTTRDGICDCYDSNQDCYAKEDDSDPCELWGVQWDDAEEFYCFDCIDVFRKEAEEDHLAELAMHQNEREHWDRS